MNSKQWREESEGLLSFGEYDEDITEVYPKAHKETLKEKVIKYFKVADDNARFWREMLLVLTAVFIAESSRGLVVPSLFLYIEDIGGGKKALGMVVAGFSVGRLFGSVLFGWWYDKRGGKEALIVSLLVSAIGNFMYTFGGITNWWMVLIARVIVGLGTGILSVVRACIADITTPEHRTRFIAYSSAVQFIGFSVVPGAAALLTYIDFKIGKLVVDQFTSAGLLLSIVNVMMIVGIMIWFPTKPISEAPKKKDDKSSIPPEMFYIGVAVFIVLNLVARGVLALLETVAAPVFLDAWEDEDGDGVTDTAQMMLVLGLIGTVIFFFIDFMEKYIAEYVLLSISFVVIGLGSLILFDFSGKGVSLAQFLIGASLVWSIGSPISQTIILSAFSKIIGSKPQGDMMGWIGSAGSVGRILFPLFSGFVGNSPSFVISAVSSFVSAIAVLVYSWRVNVQRAKFVNSDGV